MVVALKRRCTQAFGDRGPTSAHLRRIRLCRFSTIAVIGGFTTEDVLDLYRLRWRIELAFKRLKSLIGLKKPPGTDERSAKPWVLAHLLMILLLEPLVDALEDSPH
jgi:Transposase DDE domain